MSIERSPKEILKHYWGYESFRSQQEDIIQSVLEGNDTLALLPTGGGKSICFQVPALILNKLCLVISPLIALMKDQVEILNSKNINAFALHSGLSSKEQHSILEQAVSNKINFLYISPERLSSTDFIGWLRNMDIGLIAVDEAHCISQWGYDFRPEYLKIAEIRKEFNNVPVLALTASATQEVVADIVKYLNFKQSDKIFRKSFIRENLVYLVRNYENKNFKILEICKKLSGTGIIYSRNRRGTEEISLYLKQNGVSCDFYHAGLSNEERNQRQEDWINNKTRVIVCTNAFGMGIDKPDVRFVIHHEPPDCIESYYQEAGRAGRDGQKSYCVLCYLEKDINNEKIRLEEQYPDNKTLNSIYQKTCSYLKIMDGSGQGINHDFNISDFCNEYKLPQRSTYYAIKMLQRLGYLYLNESGIFTSVLKILISPQELYKIQVKNEDYNLLFLAILRTKGGYFDFYTKIEEYKIALLLNIQVSKVKHMLFNLHKAEIIDYQPKTKTPQLTLLESRYDQINPNKNQINFLKKRACQRLYGITTYINDSQTCRNSLIAKYFGENTNYNCGKCDNCIAKNAKPLTEEEFESYRKYIKEKLVSDGVRHDISSLTQGIKKSKLNNFIDALNWMMNNQWVTKNKEGEFEWKNLKK